MKILKLYGSNEIAKEA